jgi:AraC family transcriptional activator FtrA
MDVAIVVLPGMRSFDIMAALEVLAEDRSERGVPSNRVRLISSDRHVPLEHGFRIETGPLTAAHGTELLIVPGYADVDTILGPTPNRDVEATMECVRSVHQQGGQVASLCTGAFLLAATGLLDGVVSTTHWRFCERLQKRHPQVLVDSNIIYTRDPERRLWTSAGVTAGIDLCLAIVGYHHGARAQSEIARSMVLPAGRRGGQAQYVPVRYEADEALGSELEGLGEHVRQDLSRPWSLTELAALSHTSPRTLQRRFVSLTGASASRWIVDERLAVARELLESSRLPIEQIAHRVGFSSADLLRKHFTPRFGTPPSRYREAFGNFGPRSMNPSEPSVS